MAETHDTIKSLLAEFRWYAAGMPASYHVTMSWHVFRRMLDRFDAAHRRERGNAAKLREALVEARKVIKSMYWAKETLPIIDAAIDAPPRNCDVGTADDWLARFSIVCERCSGSDCDHRLFKDEEVCDCFARWLQMPYEEGGER